MPKYATNEEMVHCDICNISFSLVAGGAVYAGGRALHSHVIKSLSEETKLYSYIVNCPFCIRNSVFGTINHTVQCYTSPGTLANMTL